MKKLFIIKAGRTFKNTISKYGDFEEWVIEKLDNKNLNIKIIDIQAQESLPLLSECAGVIITGSHSMVTDEEPWSVKLEKWIPSLIEKEVALLGICYGHQLMAKALGGVSSYHKDGMEIGSVEIVLEEVAKKDELFCKTSKSFKAHTIHSQTVLTLPKGAVRLAFNTHDKNHAFRVGRNAWGVQFHPEYSCDIMKSYIQEVSKIKDIDKDKLIEEIEETKEANLLLKRFGELVEKEVKDDY